MNGDGFDLLMADEDTPADYGSAAAKPREHKTLSQLRESGVGRGGFDLGYGHVGAGDLVEGGDDKHHTGQVIEVFHDGDCWVNWDDESGTRTLKWRFIRKIGDAPVAAESAAAKHDAGGKARFALQPGVDGAAEFSPCGRYRYWLKRTWDGNRTVQLFALWIGMNPSTAEGDVDDPTIRREIAFTRAMGLNGYVKVNVMDYRATNPKALLVPGVAPCSDKNLELIGRVALCADRIVCAWGALPKRLQCYADRVQAILPRDRLECMGVTASGSPRHPLYLPNSATPQPWGRS